MLETVLIILAILAVVILAILFLASRKPNEFRVTRSGTISAPPSAVFPHIADFHNWEAWSPWAKMDPNAKNSFEGAAAGPGAMFSWSGNSKVGAGKMTILETRPSELVKIKLEFLRPMKCTNTAEFTLQPLGNQTTVIWNMYGPNSLFGKVFSLFVDCDKMVGRDFEAGLANMKEIVEGATQQ
jgi:uncharacterized protein YndB with AHSA1/START domain